MNNRINFKKIYMNQKIKLMNYFNDFIKQKKNINVKKLGYFK